MQCRDDTERVLRGPALKIDDREFVFINRSVNILKSQSSSSGLMKFKKIFSNTNETGKVIFSKNIFRTVILMDQLRTPSYYPGIFKQKKLFLGNNLNNYKTELFFGGSAKTSSLSPLGNNMRVINT